MPYRSPISKLLRFFCESRDKWKAKCKEAKRERKSLKYRLAVMTESRNRWKAEALGLRKGRPEGTTQAVDEPPKNGAGRRRNRGGATRPRVASAR